MQELTDLLISFFVYPFILGYRDPWWLGIVYGVFTSVSLYMVRFRVYTPDTAGAVGGLSLKELSLLTLLSLVLLPATVLYTVDIPGILVAAVLVLLTAWSVRDILTLLLSGLVGVIVLSGVTSVHQPLVSFFLYTFAFASHHMKFREGSLPEALLVSFISAYFPVITPSFWSVLFNVNPLYTTVPYTIFSFGGALHGITRTSLSVYLPYDMEMIAIALQTFVLSLLATFTLLSLLKWEIPHLAPVVAVSHALLSGIPNVILLLLSYVLARNTRDVRSLFGFLLFPSLLYYM